MGDPFFGVRGVLRGYYFFESKTSIWVYYIHSMNLLCCISEIFYKDTDEWFGVQIIGDPIRIRFLPPHLFKGSQTRLEKLRIQNI